MYRIMIILTFSLIVFLLPWVYLHSKYDRGVLHSLSKSSDLKLPELALVLSAGLNGKGEASKVLRDRLQQAKDLYQSGKIKIILLSGKKIPYYDEVAAMKDWLLDNGVPEKALWFDDKGFRTFDSCQNAKASFKIDQAIIVTQNFHLYRALYLCDKAGIQATGLAADIGPYSLKTKIKWNVREMFAAWRALWDTSH